MCGIFGILGTKGRRIDIEDIDACKTASSLMIRRGPDDEGFWQNEFLALSFRRLSILDLSSLGHQPMVSMDGKNAIVFNGELYNFQDLRRELETEGRVFRSRSDTEVVLNSLIEWGPSALKKFNGMFALAFWSEEDKAVLIARDHVGMKPLYYSLTDDRFVFGSQLDQLLLQYDRSHLSLDRLGLAMFLSTGHYPSPRTVFREIRQLEPGQWLKVNIQGTEEWGAHFNLFSFYQEHKDNSISISDLRDEISDSVKRHLVSDVPVATFLSGGIDSGLITGFAKSHLGEGLKAYTLSNPGTAYDETDRATRLAKYLGVNHIVVRPESLEKAIARFWEAYQEPFGDYSAIPSMFVAAEAHKDFKVILSGDGSDEFFFGYNRMVSMLQSAPYYNLPFFARRLYKFFRPDVAAITFSSFQSMIFKRQSFGDESLLVDLGISDEELASEFIKPFGGVKASRDVIIKLTTIHRYFQQQLLKLDRATMYNSLEARVPFADKKLMEYTIAFTARNCTMDGYRIRKVPLQSIYFDMHPYMSKVDGPKLGFTIDMNYYLKGPLRDVFISMLDTVTIFDPYIDLKKFRAKALADESLGALPKWVVFSLQSWANQYHRL